MNEFSIILPVRNGGEYLKQCIDSILQQTYPHFNLIILDSGSIDNTVRYINGLADSRIILYKSEKPLSIEENWGRIKDIPKNEFITLIGHDDLLAPDYLEVMNGLIEKHPEASLYQTHFNYIDAKGAVLRICKPMDEVQVASEFLSMFLMYFTDVMGTGFMMRAKDYDAVGGIPFYPNLLFADIELFLKLTALSYKATSNQNCFCYRLHQSTTAITTDIKMQQAFRQFIGFLQRLVGDNERFRLSVNRYGYIFLIFYCKSLSHRLIRTPQNKRPGISVASFIEDCKGYSNILIPEIDFHPESVLSVRLAKFIDSNIVTRKLFILFKQIVSKPIL